MEIQDKTDLDEVARNLYNFRLDHDYTPLTSPGKPANQEDDLAKTLSILDGPDPEMVSNVDLREPPPLILSASPKAKTKPRVNLIQSITITPPVKQGQKSAAPPVLQPVVLQTSPVEKEESAHEDSEKEEPPSLEPMVPIIQPKEVPKVTPTTVEDIPQTTASKPAEVKPRAKIIKIESKQQLKSERAKIEKSKTKIVKEITEEESDEDDYQEEDFDFELEDDENDSDFEIAKDVKPKQTPRRTSRRSRGEVKAVSKTPIAKTRSLSKPKSKEQNEDKDSNETIKEPEKDIKNETLEKSVDKSNKIAENSEKASEKNVTESTEDHSETKTVDKKPKKKKEAPKPLPDDFALFSTPDIIRRVGGKEPTTPSTPGTPEITPPSKPAKITPESRAKSVDQSSPSKQNTSSSRSSLDANKIEKEKPFNSHSDSKNKERRSSSSDIKTRHSSTEERLKSKLDKQTSEVKKIDRHYSKAAETAENILNTDEIPSAEDIRSIILSEDTKSYTIGSVPIDQDLNNSDPSNINLDATGLDIDPSLLDNLNNDEISEDILYQVAKSLVSNPELQNAIDKGINEGVLDPLSVEQNVVANQTPSTQVCSNSFLFILLTKICFL